MTPSESAAQFVEHIYREQLRRIARASSEPTATRRVARAMLRVGRTAAYEIMRPDNAGRIWMIADLLLGSEDALIRRERPFRSVKEMNAALLDRWRSTVGTDDTVVVAGNAGEPGGIRAGLRDAWLALPGRKLLVIGPDDIGPTGGVDAAAWNAVRLCLTTATRPPLAITHLPLETVPAGFVNLHAEPAGPAGTRGTGRRISIAADRIGFEPASVERLRQQAADQMSAATQPVQRR